MDRLRALFPQYLVAGAAALAVAVLALFFAMRSVNGERSTAAAGNRQSVQVMGRVDELQRLVTGLETNARASVITGDRRFAALARADARRVPAALTLLAVLTRGHRAQEAARVRLQADVERFVAGSMAELGTDVRAGSRGAYGTAGSARVDALERRFTAFRAVERRLAAERDAETGAAARRGTHAAWLALGGGIALILVLGGALAFQERRRRLVVDALARSEREARETHALFEAGFANAASGITAVQADGTVLQVNRRMTELTGYSEAELLAQGTERFWPGAPLDALWHGLLPRIDAEHRFVHRDGSERWLAVGAACVRDDDGTPLFVLAELHDVTARHEAEHRVEQARVALEVGNARHEAILGSIGEVVFQASLTGRWRFLSPAFERLTGIPVADALGTAAIDLVHPDDQDAHAERHGQLLVAGDATVEYEHRYTGAAGDVRLMHVEAHVTTDPETGGPVISGIMRDVTAVRAAEDESRRHLANLEVIAEVARTLPSSGDARAAVVDAALRVSDGSFAVLFEPDGDVLHATAASRDDVELPAMRFDERSGAVTALLSRTPYYVPDTLHSDVVSPALARRFGTASAVFHPVLHDGAAVAVLAVGWADFRPELSDQHRAVLGLLAAEAAVALERADLLARMESMARTDALTGLPNRLEWSERIGIETSRARRHEYALCVAVLDIDFFKRVNDTLGHQGGDELLRTAAASWRSALRDVDLIARWGGEEFAVALPSCDLDHAMVVVERLRAAMPGGRTCSAGVAEWDGTESPDAVLARADAALYRAKAGGRDRAERAVSNPVAV